MVTLDKIEDLTSLVTRIHDKDEQAIRAFWTLDTCRKFLELATSLVEIGWSTEQDSTITQKDFWKEITWSISKAKDNLIKSVDDEMLESWRRCCAQFFNKRDTIVFASFGHDTQNVVRRMVSNSQDALQLTVNFARWSERDQRDWRVMFPDS